MSLVRWHSPTDSSSVLAPVLLTKFYLRVILLFSLGEIPHTTAVIAIQNNLDDCAISIAFIGDASVDRRAPLQVTPFCKTNEELQSFLFKLSLEQTSGVIYPARMGGSNFVESYDLCALHYSNRSQLQQKGLFIIVGDERIPERTEPEMISKVLDLHCEASKTPAEIFADLKQFYHTLFINCGYKTPSSNYPTTEGSQRVLFVDVESQWKTLLGPDCVLSAPTPDEASKHIIAASANWAKLKSSLGGTALEIPRTVRTVLPNTPLPKKAAPIGSLTTGNNKDWILLVSRAVGIVVRRLFCVEFSAKRWVHTRESCEESDLVLTSVGEALFPLCPLVSKLLKSLSGVCQYVVKCCITQGALKVAKWYCDYYGVTKSTDPFASFMRTPKGDSGCLPSILATATTPEGINVVQWILEYFRIPTAIFCLSILRCLNLAEGAAGTKAHITAFKLLIKHFGPMIRDDLRKNPPGGHWDSAYVPSYELRECLQKNALQGEEVEIFKDIFEYIPVDGGTKQHCLFEGAVTLPSPQFLEWLLPQIQVTEDKARQYVQYAGCSRSVELLVPYAKYEKDPSSLDPLFERLMILGDVKQARDLAVSFNRLTPRYILDSKSHHLIDKIIEAFPNQLEKMGYYDTGHWALVSIWRKHIGNFQQQLRWVLDRVPAENLDRYKLLASLSIASTPEGLEWAFNTIHPELRTADEAADNAAMIKSMLTSLVHGDGSFAPKFPQQMPNLAWLENKVGKIPQPPPETIHMYLDNALLLCCNREILEWLFSHFTITAADINSALDTDMKCQTCVRYVEPTRYIITHCNNDRDVLLKLLWASMVTDSPTSRETYELVKSNMTPPLTIEEKRRNDRFFSGLGSHPWLWEECQVTQDDLVRLKFFSEENPGWGNYYANSNPTMAQWVYDKYGLASPY
ncbi:hypothetical protein Pelo_8484 [Pelomyxa schiedti]|nr:hypothetical protein Pelo_8484 [Pelomyxa schiedti]